MKEDEGVIELLVEGWGTRPERGLPWGPSSLFIVSAGLVCGGFLTGASFFGDSWTGRGTLTACPADKTLL